MYSGVNVIVPVKSLVQYLAKILSTSEIEASGFLKFNFIFYD